MDLVDALAQRYSKLPTDILELTPADFHLNLCIAFPEQIQKKHRRAERKAAEHSLGYNPVRRFIEMMKRK